MVKYLARTRCYLSGPIEATNPDEPNWRNEPKQVLWKEFGINIFDPFDDPKQQWVPILKEARDKCDYETMRNIAKNFVRKDLSLVDRSDYLIAYLPYKVPTTGSVHEIINSNNAKKPTLIVSDGHKKNVPLWLYGFIPHNVMFGCWDDLYDYLHEVNDGKHKDNNRWHFIYGMV